MNLFSYFTRSNHNFYYDIKKLLSFGHRGHYEQSKSIDSTNVNEYVENLYHNDDFISAVAGAYEMGVSATMANIQSRTEDRKFNRIFELLIEEWSHNPEITNRYFRGDAEQAQVREFAVMSGGYIKIHHYSKSFKFGYKYELLSLHSIDQTDNSFDNNIYFGIKTNKRFGDIKALKIYTDSTRTHSKWVNYSKCTLVINRWASTEQYNGISPIAPILKGLKYTKEYHDEEMHSAKRRSRNNILIASPYFGEMLNKILKFFKGQKQIDAYQESFDSRRIDGDNLTGVKYIDKDEVPHEMGKGVSNPYQDIYRNRTRAMSASVRLSPMLTIGEMPSSYNAMLYFSQKDERVFKSIFQKLVWLDWKDTIYRLLDGLVMKNLIEAPNYWLDSTKYKKVEFMREGIGHIDPIKQQKSISEGLINGTLNSIEIQAQRGVDYEAHIAKEVEYEFVRRKMFEEAGLVYIQKGTESCLTPKDLANEDD